MLQRERALFLALNLSPDEPWMRYFVLNSKEDRFIGWLVDLFNLLRLDVLPSFDWFRIDLFLQFRDQYFEAMIVYRLQLGN